MTISLFGRVKNTVGEGENAGYQHFLLFLQCFPKPSSSLKVGTVWQRVNSSPYTKLLDSSTLKEFTGNNSDVFILEEAENNVGKGDIAGYT